MSWTSIFLSLTNKPSPAVIKGNHEFKSEVDFIHAQFNKAVFDETVAENARLKAEVERLERLVNYWKVEANCDHDRWLRVLADLDDLRRAMK
jgi:hypothetical protein